MTPQQYYSVLASWGVDPESERTRIRAEKSWVYWISGFYGRRVRVSEAEISSYMADVSARASKPSYLVGEIFIVSPTKSRAEWMLTGSSVRPGWAT